MIFKSITFGENMLRAITGFFVILAFFVEVAKADFVFTSREARWEAEGSGDVKRVMYWPDGNDDGFVDSGTGDNYAFATGLADFTENEIYLGWDGRDIPLFAMNSAVAAATLNAQFTVSEQTIIDVTVQYNAYSNSSATDLNWYVKITDTTVTGPLLDIGDTISATPYTGTGYGSTQAVVLYPGHTYTVQAHFDVLSVSGGEGYFERPSVLIHSR